MSDAPQASNPHQAEIDDCMRRLGLSFEEPSARITRLVLRRVCRWTGTRRCPRACRSGGASACFFGGRTGARRTSEWGCAACSSCATGVEKQYVEAYGLEATRHLLQAVQERLVSEGFKPGADGMDLSRLQ